MANSSKYLIKRITMEITNNSNTIYIKDEYIPASSILYFHVHYIKAKQIIINEKAYYQHYDAPPEYKLIPGHIHVRLSLLSKESISENIGSYDKDPSLDQQQILIQEQIDIISNFMFKPTLQL